MFHSLVRAYPLRISHANHSSRFHTQNNELDTARSTIFSDDEYRVDPMPTSQASLLAFAMLSEYLITAVFEYMLAEHLGQNLRLTKRVFPAFT